jgi:hypothetical protein
VTGTPDDPSDFIVPDDLSKADPVRVAVLLTAVANHRTLAAVCSIARVSAGALGTSAGAVAVLDDPQTGHVSAAALSRALPGTDVFLVERRTNIDATVWTGGRSRGPVPPGLVLAEVPSTVESILLGTEEPADLELVRPVQPRIRALWSLLPGRNRTQGRP